MAQPMPTDSREQIEQLYKLGFTAGAINYLFKEAGHSTFRDTTAKAKLDQKASELLPRLEERKQALTQGIIDHLKKDSPVRDLRRKFEGIENSWHFRLQQNAWVAEAYKGGLRFLGDAAAATAESIGTKPSPKPSENFNAIEAYQQKRSEVLRPGQAHAFGANTV